MLEQVKHLEFIQEVTTRMNANSFHLKGWTLTIVSALLALYVSSSNVCYIFVAVFSTVVFWALDSYYLQQERKFRVIYDNVAGIKNDIKIKPFEMPIRKIKGDQCCFYKVLFSKTTVCFYGAIILILFGIWIVTYIK